MTDVQPWAQVAEALLMLRAQIQRLDDRQLLLASAGPRQEAARRVADSDGELYARLRRHRRYGTTLSPRRRTPR